LTNSVLSICDKLVSSITTFLFRLTQFSIIYDVRVTEKYKTYKLLLN